MRLRAFIEVINYCLSQGNKKSPFGKALFCNYDFGAETGNLFREEDFHNKWKIILKVYTF